MRTIKTIVVGSGLFVGARAHLLRLPGDCPLDLLREPDNPHDPNAILVLDARRRLGYIPRVVAARIAPFMDAGVMVICHVHIYPPQILLAWGSKKDEKRWRRLTDLDVGLSQDLDGTYTTFDHQAAFEEL